MKKAKVITCLGDTVKFNPVGEFLVVHLPIVKKIEYSEVFGENIEIYFIEKFKRMLTIIKDANGNRKQLDHWQSQGIF